jgi:hypothetical protein
MASSRVVYGDIQEVVGKFWLGNTLTAAVTVVGSAAATCDVSENTSSKPMVLVCVLFLQVANYATLFNVLHRVALIELVGS